MHIPIKQMYMGMASVLMSVAGTAVLFDYIGAFFTAYRKISAKLESERWMLEKCKDNTFFSNMRAHTTVCTEFETNARIGAFWNALREVTDLRVVWQPYIVGVLILVLLCCVYPKKREEIPTHNPFTSLI